MALKIDLPTSFDVTASYWAIAEEHKNFVEGSNRVVLYGYASAASKNKGSQPLSSAQITIQGTNFDPTANRAALYTYIKTNLDQFTAALDV